MLPVRLEARAAAGLRGQRQPSYPCRTWPGRGCPCPRPPAGCIRVELEKVDFVKSFVHVKLVQVIMSFNRFQKR